LSLKSDIEISATVELDKHSKELGKLITLFKLIIITLKLREDFCEVSHNVRLNGNSKKENDRHHKSLQITSGVVVSKSHCTEGSEHVVCHDYTILTC